MKNIKFKFSIAKSDLSMSLGWYSFVCGIYDKRKQIEGMRGKWIIGISFCFWLPIY